MVSKVSLDFKREIYDRINWKPRIIGIKGPKGVGKSTLLKQHILEAFAQIYVTTPDSVRGRGCEPGVSYFEANQI